MRDGVWWGYIDTTGKMVIPAKYESASYFDNGRAEVVLNGVIHNIDKTGKCVKNCKKLR